MKILITGGTGFIGSHLTKKLREIYNTIDDEVYTVSRRRLLGGNPSKGYTFYAPIGSDSLGHCQADLKHISMDLSDKLGVARMMKVVNPDIIFHLAGNPMVKPGPNSLDLFKDNVFSTLNLCEYAPIGCKFVLASTVVVYNFDKSPMLGNDFCEWDAAEPISLYGTTKLASEGIVHTYTNYGNIEGKILRLCGTVGTGLTHGIVYDFINKLKSSSIELEVLGDYPGSEKPFSYIDDVVSAFIQSVNMKLDRPVNISPDADSIMSVLDIANTVMYELNIQKKIKWLGKKSTWAGDNKIINVENEYYRTHFERKFKTSKEAIVQAIRDINES